MVRGTEDAGSLRETRLGATKAALAARDHAAFSVMVYAGLRIEETTALGLGRV